MSTENRSWVLAAAGWWLLAIVLGAGAGYLARYCILHPSQTRPVFPPQQVRFEYEELPAAYRDAFPQNMTVGGVPVAYVMHPRSVQFGYQNLQPRTTFVCIPKVGKSGAVILSVFELEPGDWLPPGSPTAVYAEPGDAIVKLSDTWWLKLFATPQPVFAHTLHEIALQCADPEIRQALLDLEKQYREDNPAASEPHPMLRARPQE